MLNDEKIRLMTGIAMFEKREGKRIFPANRYFKRDYIGSHLLRSFFSYTLCFALCLVVWALYSMENLFSAMNLDDIGNMIWKTGSLYAAGLVLYLILTAYVYNKRYEYAKRGMRVYLAKLKRLEKKYDTQGRGR